MTGSPDDLGIRAKHGLQPDPLSMKEDDDLSSSRADNGTNVRFALTSANGLFLAMLYVATFTMLILNGFNIFGFELDPVILGGMIAAVIGISAPHFIDIKAHFDHNSQR